MAPCRKGVTMPEIVLAVGLMAFSFLPIFSMLSSSNAASRQQKAEGIAVNLAKEYMNKIMFVILKTNFTWPDNRESQFDSDVTIEGMVFQVFVTVVRHPNNATNVTWPEHSLHDFSTTCPNGAEGFLEDNTTKITSKTRTIESVTRDPATDFRLLDILLRVRWRQPNTAVFRDSDQLVLVSRRSFYH